MLLQPIQLLLNKYHIERLIGEGGFGYVYEAEDVLLHRRVAIKELKPELACDAEELKRFIREAEAASAVNHPNIVAVHGLEVVGDSYYIIMEFVGGGDLARRLRTQGALALGEATRIAIALLDALNAVHRRGIIHRDIKPSNILFTTDGQVKLGDFGIARKPTQGAYTLTQTGAVLGTVQYMSPEQARGEPADAHSDIYAVGAVLYEMLTGRPYAIFTDNVLSNLEMVKAHTPRPLPASIPQSISYVVLKALAKSRQARFQSASEMGYALRSALTPPTIRWIPHEQNTRLSLLPMIIGAIGFIALCAFTVLALLQQNNVAEQARATQQAQTQIAIAFPTMNVLTTLPATATRPAISSPVATPSLHSEFATTPKVSATIRPTSVVTTTAPPTTPTPIPANIRTVVTAPTATPPGASPAKELVYATLSGDTVKKLMDYFILGTQPSSDEFYKRHQTEFRCAPPFENDKNCIQPGMNLRIKWEELNPQSLADVQTQPGNLVWLTVYLDDSILGLPSLGGYQAYKDHWILARGKWRGSIDNFGEKGFIPSDFIIDPVGFVFVYDPATNAYTRSK